MTNRERATALALELAKTLRLGDGAVTFNAERFFPFIKRALDAACASRDEELALLRRAVDGQCEEHASNCCADWCVKCQAGDDAIAALDAWRKERA